MAAMSMEDLAYLNMSNGKRLTRCSNLRNASTAKAAVQAITEAESRCSGSSRLSSIDDNGGVRQVKLVIRKKDLKQMVASLGWVKLGVNGHKFPSPAALEQFFNALRTKQLKKAELERNGCRSSRWEPALHSIPEEF